MISSLFSTFITMVPKKTITSSSNMIMTYSPIMIFTRGLMKTHKGAAKRWIKTANGYKRGKAGRKHGNVGWSQRLLQAKDGKTEALGKGHGDMKKKLRRLLPYH